MGLLSDLTAERLRQVLTYDPATGVFRWLVNTGWKKNLKGSVAGNVDAHGYIVIRIDGVQYKAHRLAFLYMKGAWPDGLVDHKNTARDDNRWDNLRKATAHQNCANRRVNSRNKLRVKGVRKIGNRYLAKICVNGDVIHLGSFKTLTEAADTYKEAAELAFDEYASA